MKKLSIYVFATAIFGLILLVGLFSSSVDSRPVMNSDLAKTKIVYIVRDEGGGYIYTMKPDGSNITRLTTHPDRDVNPT